MGGQTNTQKILQGATQVLQLLLTWSQESSPSLKSKQAADTAHSVAPGVAKTDNPAKDTDNNDFQTLQQQLETDSSNIFTTKYTYTWNNQNTSPPTWDGVKKFARSDFVNCPVAATDQIGNYINQNVTATAPAFCQQQVSDDLVGLVKTLLQNLPTQGFESQMFSKVYNNAAGAKPAAVQLDSVMYYTAATVPQEGGGSDQNTLFMNFNGIYYTTSPWMNKNGSHTG